ETRIKGCGAAPCPHVSCSRLGISVHCGPSRDEVRPDGKVRSGENPGAAFKGECDMVAHGSYDFEHCTSSSLRGGAQGCAFAMEGGCWRGGASHGACTQGDELRHQDN